ncbi:hypothetical protein KBD68_03140 [Candidatus Woesebacteria bacterium]|nr:hypothetical protein [Candidatus Woesebacteria bacterium]
MFDGLKSFMKALLRFVVQFATFVLVCGIIQALSPTLEPRYAYLYETPVLRDLIIGVFLMFFILGNTERIAQKHDIDMLTTRLNELEMKVQNKTTEVK